jgi:hypothetical protein
VIARDKSVHSYLPGLIYTSSPSQLQVCIIIGREGGVARERRKKTNVCTQVSFTLVIFGSERVKTTKYSKT